MKSEAAPKTSELLSGSADIEIIASEGEYRVIIPKNIIELLDDPVRFIRIYTSIFEEKVTFALEGVGVIIFYREEDLKFIPKIRERLTAAYEEKMRLK